MIQLWKQMFLFCLSPSYRTILNSCFLFFSTTDWITLGCQTWQWWPGQNAGWHTQIRCQCQNGIVFFIVNSITENKYRPVFLYWGKFTKTCWLILFFFLFPFCFRQFMGGPPSECCKLTFKGNNLIRHKFHSHRLFFPPTVMFHLIDLIYRVALRCTLLPCRDTQML